MEENMKGFWVVGVFFLIIGAFIGFLLGYAPAATLTGNVVADVSAGNCFDSDGGVNYMSYGYAVDKNIRYFDNCLDEQNLYEAFCKDSGVSVKKFSCAYGCSNGACISP